MRIKTKLQLLAVTTIGTLGVALLVTVFGLNSILDKNNAAHRRESYTRDLIEIKASAISTIMLDPTLPETRDVFNDAEKSIEERSKTVLSAIKRPEIRETLQKLLAQWAQYDKASQALLELAKTDAKAANERVVPLYNSQFKSFQAALDKFVDDRVHDAGEATKNAEEASNQVFWTIVPILAIGALLVIGFVLILSQSIQAALRGVLTKLEPIKDGNLTERLPDNGQDELSEIAHEVNNFIAQLQQIVRQVAGSAHSLSSASTRMQSSSRQVAESSVHQSDAAASTAAAIEELTVSVATIADTPRMSGSCPTPACRML